MVQSPYHIRPVWREGYSLEPVPGPGSSQTQQPGWPWFPQQLAGGMRKRRL